MSIKIHTQQQAKEHPVPVLLLELIHYFPPGLNSTFPGLCPFTHSHGHTLFSHHANNFDKVLNSPDTGKSQRSGKSMGYWDKESNTRMAFSKEKLLQSHHITQGSKLLGREIFSVPFPLHCTYMVSQWKLWTVWNLCGVWFFSLHNSSKTF